MTRRLKVVHVHKIAGVSGSEKHMLLLLSALDRAAFEPHVLMLAGRAADDAGFADRLQRGGVRVDRLEIRGHVDPILVARLVAWFRRERPDIVHTHLIHADVHAIPAARLAGVPVVISTKHNDDRFRRYSIFVSLERWLGARVDRTIAISEALRQFILTSTRQDAARVVTVRYGYDPSVDARPEVDAPSPIPPGRRIVLAVGRLVDQKGHDVLVAAFRRVRARIPDAHLVIVGGGPRRPRLEAQARRLGLADAVTLTGHRQDTRALMRSAAVLAHPSRWEGFGLVLLEAMAERLPIVATRVSAIPEIVAHGSTGVLVAIDDDAALADALIGLLAAPTDARRMGEAGRARLDREFSLERMTRATEEIYRTLSAERRMSRARVPSAPSTLR